MDFYIRNVYITLHDTRRPAPTPSPPGPVASQLAALIGVASNTVARWERGELGMKPTTARLIQLVTQRKLKKE